MLSEKNLPIHVCAVCDRLISDESSKLVSGTSSLFSPIRDESNNLVIDKCGCVGLDYWVCDRCHSSLSSGMLSKLTILNGFDLGCNHQIPEYLRNLTEVKEILIAKSWLFRKVRKLGKK